MSTQQQNADQPAASKPHQLDSTLADGTSATADTPAPAVMDPNPHAEPELCAGIAAPPSSPVIGPQPVRSATRNLFTLLYRLYIISETEALLEEAGASSTMEVPKCELTTLTE